MRRPGLRRRPHRRRAREATHDASTLSVGAAGKGVLARLRDSGLHPRKALGQHFLHDPKLLAALVDEAGVTAAERVFEVGTGPGTLTRELAQRAERVLTLDVDPRMLAFAREELSGFTNVSFLCCDALEGRSRISAETMSALHEIEPFVWVSNLPYGIAATLIVAVCESGLEWTRAALLVQSEVADRLGAGPGEAAYGPASVLTAYWADARPGRKIPPGAFWPPPTVESRVIHLARKAPLGPSEAYESYRGWVRRLFVSRRKQLGGILKKALGEMDARRLLSRRGWDPSLRPENLGPEDFLHLAQEFPAFSR